MAEAYGVDAEDERGQLFGFFRGYSPGQSGRVRGVADGTSYRVQRSYSISQPQATTVLAIVRTKELYVDRNTVAVAFQLRDDAGNTQVTSSGLTVKLQLVHSDGTLERTSTACALSITSAGVGECTDALPTAWFSSAGSASS